MAMTTCKSKKVARPRAETRNDNGQKVDRQSVDQMISAMAKGQRLALSRLLSKVEARAQDRKEIISKLYPKTGNAKVIGITGPPGAGKSTLVDCLTYEIRKQNKKVAIVAVDPSSPFSGGAILGDRIRMQGHFNDPSVFIRSLGTRGKHGGLSHSSREVVWVLDAAGYDYILVETAGVGQTELDIMRLSQTVVVVLVPESGDSIQVMKAGLMEIADVFAVNKSDRPEADLLVKELFGLVHGKLGTGEPSAPQAVGGPGKSRSAGRPSQAWQIPVLKTQGHVKQGVLELLGQIDAHQAYLRAGGALEQRNRTLLEAELLEILSDKVGLKLKKHLSSEQGRKSFESLMDKKTDPYSYIDSEFSKYIK